MQSEIGLFALESWAFWTGIVALGMTAAGALLGCLLLWFPVKANSLESQTVRRRHPSRRSPTRAPIWNDLQIGSDRRLLRLQRLVRCLAAYLGGCRSR